MEMSNYDFDHSLDGMLRALIGEQDRVWIHSEIVRADQHGPMTVITLKAKQSEGFVNVKEGWRIRGTYDDGSSWYAEIIDIDRHYPPTVVVCGEKEITENIGPKCWFSETDFLEQVRTWISRKRDSNSAELPMAYLQLIHKHPLTKETAGGRMPLVPEVSENLRKAVEKFELSTSLPLRPAQKRAVKLVTQEFGVVWGPPGTGKTYTLGALVNALRTDNNKVLILAPTNVAADTAALAIDSAATKLGFPIEPGELVRPGYPQLPELESRPHLMGWQETLEQMRVNLSTKAIERQKLERERTRSHGRSRKQLQQTVAKHKLDERNLKSARSKMFWNLAPSARIIVTTLHSAMNNEEILNDILDHNLNVILDEAGMIPRFLFARLMDLEPDRLFLFGDFKQLGPIRHNRNKQDRNSIYWIGHSAFDAVGLTNIDDAEEMEKNDLLVMLTQQSRMRTELCESVSKVFYGGKLAAVDSAPAIISITNQPESGIVIADPDLWQTEIARLMPELPEREKVKNHCPRAVMTAVGIASAILQTNENATTLLLSPFKNQASALNKYASSVIASFEGRWKAGTVHISQGQEGDFVIFCPVKPSHGWLTGRMGRLDIERLLCVTFSRARTQVIVVAKPNEIPSCPLLKELCAGASEWKPSFCN